MTASTQRIVSLLPGATEWVCHLGLGSNLVGVSHQCDFPPQVQRLPKLTAPRIDASQSSREIDAVVRDHCETRTPLYDLDVDAFTDLNPDLIITQSLCNVCAVSERDVMTSLNAMNGPCRLLDLQAQTFEEVMVDGQAIIEATGGSADSRRSLETLSARIDIIRAQAGTRQTEPPPTVTLLEWVDPLFCAGHWTPQLIQWAGGVDPIGKSGQPSRVISPEELWEADPQILLVACCGMDEERTRREMTALQELDSWHELRCVRSGAVHALDGSAYFNRPGPRLVDALEMVASLIANWQQRRPLPGHVPLSS